MAPHQSPNLVPSLSIALVACSIMPLLLLDRDLRVLAASATFCGAFGIDPARVSGTLLQNLGQGEWNISPLISLLNATATGDAKVDSYEMDFQGKDHAVRQLVLNAQKIAYDEDDNVRLVLSIADVTDARASETIKKQLLQDKEVLLRELHHRVANSLQIIASVLMQSARKVQSEESRLHLMDAHQRVMSVASLQRQLAANKVGNVELRPYFKALCDSIGASMIADREQVSLEVTIDDSITTADTSVSLGLILTELVINALKHAFPDNRGGHIVVDYRTRGADWTLSVSDDGVGMRTDSEPAKGGLGTGIVEALSRQLHAKVKVESTAGGTRVAIVHTYIPVLVSQAAHVVRPV